jgi:hypothetical protein
MPVAGGPGLTRRNQALRSPRLLRHAATGYPWTDATRLAAALRTRFGVPGPSAALLFSQTFRPVCSRTAALPAVFRNYLKRPGYRS